MNRDLNTSFSSSNLLCQETQQEQEACFSETAKESHHYKSPCSDNEDDDEYIENLVQRETTTDDLFTTKTWLKSARFDAIQWIFNTRETFGFQVHTAYLSVTYFDRFIATRSIDEGKMWAIPLLSIACLSLAAKMEEPKVPFLSEFHTKDYQFENKVIQRMELMVLTTLGWKMSSATPFCYLHYFIRKFHGEFETKGLICKAIEFIIAIIKEMSLVDCRPSIIAAAAVLAALNGGLTRKAMEDKIGCISLWGSLQSEHIFSCYNMVVEIEMRKYVSDGGGGGDIKRKLTFNHSSDQNSLSKKICRP
ncbi:hypothetical protein ERO13_D03G028201v2 [Gossypium hirsutum]|uniref:Cyclin-D5-1 isoform X2 n=1 Tax=Gossypium hirsutum TaxID=3635 RepID=A0ABM2ZSG5_GOSHI|nr:cyclin-D5-1-like isoform X2 [Gossypium hirsutum]KAG4153982.1 hypothetical protein ERO13_D03G028201v2 [Gossypium hirsutum]